MSTVTYAQEIASTTVRLMDDDESVIVLGEGVADPKGIFGTTKAAHEKYPDRVYETPLSENLLTGALAGMASNGLRPIYVHARAEFSLLAFEHMVNTIAKWPWLHGGQNLPIIIRMLVGRGWGQGPTHSQSFHGWLQSVPGLNVYYPVFAHTVQWFFRKSCLEGKPSIIIEPRRMYQYSKALWDYGIRKPPRSPKIVFTTLGDCVLEAMAAANAMNDSGVHATVNPVEELLHWYPPSLHGHNVPIVVVDTAHGQADWLVSNLSQAGYSVGLVQPPNTPCPTAEHLERQWYPTAARIWHKAADMLGLPHQTVQLDDDVLPVRDGRIEAF